MPASEATAAKTAACRVLKRPVGNGREAVRSIAASQRRSTSWFIAVAPAINSAVPSSACASRIHGGGSAAVKAAMAIEKSTVNRRPGRISRQ